jgi:uncharacterized membrane protein
MSSTLRDIDRTGEAAEHATKHEVSYTRRGAMWGAMFGFMIGLIPLFMSTILAAAAGALLAKGSQLRIQAGSPVRIHSVRDSRAARE